MNSDRTTHPAAATRSPLLAEFAPPTLAAWREAATKSLKGSPLDRLKTRTAENIELQPIYNLEDVVRLALHDLPGFDSRRRGSRASGPLALRWLLSQELAGTTPEAFNVAALDALARDQNELHLRFDTAGRAGRDSDDATADEVGTDGLSLATLPDFERALAGIDLRAISLCLHPGTAVLAGAALFFALARRRSLPLNTLRGCISCDPLGHLAAHGRLPLSLDLSYQEMASVTDFAHAEAPEVRTIAVQTHLWHDAGANAVQELAIALATGVEYLRVLERHGVPPARAARHVRFGLSAGSQFFMEVAKFRALRQLWSRALTALDVRPEDQRLHLHVRTSGYTKTACDVHTNILRATTEALSAVIGGCDSLHVGAFDEAVGEPRELARRVAHNTHAILAEECELTRVIDPAGGSYYVEWLTDQVARQAWRLFQEIEQDGGMTHALTAGIPQAWVSATAAARADAVARRRTTVIGANQYPNANDTFTPAHARPGILRDRIRSVCAHRRAATTRSHSLMLERMVTLLDAQADGVVASAAMTAALHGATLGEICHALRVHDERGTEVKPVKPHRAGAPFERLRAAVARWAGQNGRPPRVFQANVGPSAAYRLRADWTSAFFAVGGFQVLNEQDFADATAAADAALASGARIVVITADDATYPSVVASLARRLKERDPQLTILVAGTPGELAEAWRAAGVDEFVNRSSNALDLLTRLLTPVGVLS